MNNFKGIYERCGKRIFDVFLSFFMLVILSPILLLTGILVCIKLGTPIVFAQPRPGLNSRVFTLYKFRTMTDERDENGELLSDEVRLTKFGKILRSTSLDELPELWNILKGDMSFVGPRPLLVSYLDRYNEVQKRRHEVRPGLTGLAQVNGRNTISWEEKFAFDVQYVDNVSFWGDIQILWKTVWNVLKRDGISSETSETMEEFMGTKEEEK